MQLLQVKGNIARINYNPTENHLLPSDFLLIEDKNQKLIAQIINISTTDDININIADLRLILSIDNTDNLSFYNGYIPLKTASVIYIKSDEIIELIKSTGENLYLGNLSNHNDCFVKVPFSSIDDRLYIQSDRYDKIKIFIQNLVSELTAKEKKVVILDFDGQYNSIPSIPRIKISESFKLPLNAEAFNNILEYDTKDCPLEDKAVIQSIVLELREYIKTVDNKFLPFTLFKTVIDNEFASNPISGLLLLRNKLWMYAQENIFAETKNDFGIINKILENQNILIIDASSLEEKWYKFAIQAIETIINKKCYMVLSLNDVDTDKKAITNLYNNPNITPIVSTNYDSGYRQILKALCKNQILFKPSRLIEDEEIYNSFINRINSSEFIFYGESALYIPLILKLESFDSSTKENITQNEIEKEVDKFFNSSKNIIPQQHPVNEPFIKDESEETIEIAALDEEENIEIKEEEIADDDDITDEDLDFLDSQSQEKITIEDIKKTKDIEEQPDNSYDVFNPEPDNNDTEEIETVIDNEDENSIEIIDEQENSENKSEITSIEDAALINDDDDLFTELPDEDDIISISDNKDEYLIEDIPEKENEIEYKVEHNTDSNNINDNLEDDILFNESETETVTNIDVSANEENMTSEEAIIKPMGAYSEEELIKPMGAYSEDEKIEEENQPTESRIEETKEIEEEETDENTGNEEEIASIDDVINDIEDKASNSEPINEEKEEIEEKIEEQKPAAPSVNKNVKEKKSPELPYYETEIPQENNQIKLDFKVGDKVFHPKHGNGTVLGFAQYKNTMYCRIEFEGEGFRILDPRVSALEKV